MGNRELFEKCHIGTKKLIEDYNNELVAHLRWLNDAMPQGSHLERHQKTDFFLNLRHTLGNTALILSGGAALGTL